MSKKSILWVENNLRAVINLRYTYKDVYNIEFSSTYEEALQAHEGKDLIVSKYNLGQGEDRTGVNLLKDFRDAGVSSPIVFVAENPENVIKHKAEVGIEENNLILHKYGFDKNLWRQRLDAEMK